MADRQYTDFAVSSIIETIEERYKEAEEKRKQKGATEFDEGYWLAYYEVVDIIKSRQDI